MEQDTFTEVYELRVWCASGKQGADIQSQLLKNALFHDAVAVKQIGKESITVNCIQVGFLDSELARALHIAKNSKHFIIM